MEIQISNVEIPVPRHARDCPVEDWLTLLGHRWCALILWHLNAGPCRYKDLQEKLVGVRPKVLTERLNLLVSRDVIERFEKTGYPRTVRYSLTRRGRAVVAILDQFERLR